jgi:hypothetical protein
MCVVKGRNLEKGEIESLTEHINADDNPSPIAPTIEELGLGLAILQGAPGTRIDDHGFEVGSEAPIDVPHRLRSILR